MQFFLLAFLIGREHCFARCFLEVHGAIIERYEIPLVYLPTIDERQNQTIRKQRSEFFQKIKRQTRTPRSVPVQKANGGIKTYGFKSRTAIMGEQGVQERQERIDGIGGRPPVTPFEAQGWRVYPDKVVKYAKINLRRFAFQTTENVRFRFLEQTMRFKRSRACRNAAWASFRLYPFLTTHRAIQRDGIFNEMRHQCQS